MLLIVPTLGIAACGDKSPADNARAAGDAVQATVEYLDPPKDAEVKAAQDQLAGLERGWQTLLAKAAPTTDKAKVELRDADKQMTAAIAAAKVKLVEAKAASDKDWQQNVKPALDAAVEKSQKLHDDVYARFGGNSVHSRLRRPPTRIACRTGIVLGSVMCRERMGMGG